MARKSKIFLVAVLATAAGAAAALLFAHFQLADAAMRTAWTGRFAPGLAPTVIIVLGMGPTDAGAVGDRAELAADVWKQSLAQTIVASGGLGRNEDEAESTTLSHLLTRFGVPANVIVEESNSRSTFENLKFSQALLRSNGLSATTVAVVTHDFHACRTEAIARSLGLKGTVVSVRGKRLGFNLFMHCRELLAYWKWRILGW